MINIKKINGHYTFIFPNGRAKCIKPFISMANRKTVKLYKSPVYKENIISFIISDSKSFIFDKKSWTHFVNLIPIIDNFYNGDRVVQPKRYSAETSVHIDSDGSDRMW